MFTPFILAPMGEDQLKRIVKEKLIEQFQREAGGDVPEKADHDVYILQRVFDGYFTLLKKEISGYTTNLNEYVYVFGFLYDHYIEPLKLLKTA